MTISSRQLDSPEPCKSFSEVVDAEVQDPIRKRRLHWRNLAEANSATETYPETDGQDLAGLALSGGGIRSAMFNLGLLQSFQRSGLMKHMDYIASVSGGGYTNGYYSTLGHFRNAPTLPDDDLNQTQSEPPKSVSEPIDKLSARDAQFLLEGQYLNHPIEFITDYILKTSVFVGSAAACLLMIASTIALYFRFYDFPFVRRWLNLLDISTDLRAGIFSIVVLIVITLAGRVVYLSLMGALRRSVQLAPGQWVLYVVGITFLGIAIMIGNGDFYISNGQGLLPEKWDFKSLQVPLTVAVVLLFSPMLRFSTLLKSERVNATVGQKIALWIILFGTSWGTLLAAVGWIGKENVSGFVTNRPPKFENYDILNYGELARLLKDSSGSPEDDPNRLSTVLNLRKRLALDSKEWIEVLKSIDAVIENERQIVAERSALYPEQREWDSWLNFSNQSLTRWANTLAAAASISKRGSVANLISTDRYQSEEIGPQLSAYVEAAINPASERANNLHPKNLDELVFEDKKSREILTRGLLRLAAHKVKKPESTVAKETKDQQATINHVERLMAWVEAGGHMVRKDLKPYKDLGNFNQLMRKCWYKPDGWNIESLSDLDEWRLNRMLLEIGFPDVFKERAMISTSIVVGKDQEFRVTILLASLFGSAVGFFFLDFNKLCAWFHFYRRRIGETFLQKAHRDGIMKLRELNPTKNGYPYPLFVSALILPQAPSYSRVLATRKDHNNPTKLDGSFASNWYSFVFSPLFCGWLPTGTRSKYETMHTYRSTREYLDGELHVDQAVVLSGAAMTPFMSDNPSLRFLMHLFNIRLEQWLPNPRMLKQPKQLSFSLVDLVKEWNTRATWGPDSWHFGVVADGGFREFLGVEELIARRCKIIVVSDAGCNNGLYEFGVLADLIRKLRLDHSVEVYDLDHDRPLDTRRLKRPTEAEGYSPQHFVLGRIRYPEKVKGNEGEDPRTLPHEEALLVYVQMSLTGDEDIDIAQFRRTNPQFPDEPISNQFYSRDQVESFRQLGEHIGKLLCRDISPFHCPKFHNKGNQTQPLTSDEQREWRIRTLADAFRSSYRNECRQESTIAVDDARIGWMMSINHVAPSTIRHVYQYESTSERQLVVRDFVWSCLEDYESERAPHFEHLRPADLFGIAIECNRRHAGFRPEWPTAYFQVTGRELLIKASQLSEEFFAHASNATTRDSQPTSLDDFFLAPTDNDAMPTMSPMLTAISRLAVMLPRGVFRLAGEESSAEVVVCLIGYLVNYRRGSSSASLEWIRCEESQKKLRKAIKTGKAPEVAMSLIELYRNRHTVTH